METIKNIATGFFALLIFATTAGYTGWAGYQTWITTHSYWETSWTITVTMAYIIPGAIIGFGLIAASLIAAATHLFPGKKS